MHEEARNRQNHLFLVVDNLQREHEAWSDSDTPYITEDLENAIEETALIFSTGDIPATCRRLEATVADMAEQWEEYKQQAQVTNDPSILPGNGFWRALRQVEDVRRLAAPQKRVTLESIDELREQKVSPAQICRMYGWVDADGAPELHKLSEEIAKPGTHVNEDFVPPLQRALDEKNRKAEQALERIRKRQESKIRNLTEPAPEPWEQLFEQEISAKQIARMKKCTVEEVMEKAEELGFGVDLEYADVRTERAPVEQAAPQETGSVRPTKKAPKKTTKAKAPKKKRGRPPKKKEPEPEPEYASGSWEDEVRELIQGGMEPSVVAQACSTPERTLTVADVQRVVSQQTA